MVRSGFALWDSEQCAGAAFVPAGFSSGRGVGARERAAGGASYVSISCSIMPVARFSRNVLRSITPAVCRLCAKQDGLREVAFLFRRGS